MLKNLFQQQKINLDFFFNHLDISQAETIVQKLLHCTGVIFLTGVGKSGFIAQKIAATLVSTGTKAFYLSPLDALHGDLGIVSHQDMFVIFSKSGESEELLKLLPYVRSKGAAIIAICSNRESRLVKAADDIAILPCLKELCPYDLAPTTSTELQLLFGDILAIALMREKGFSQDQYATNHPAGQIGKRMTLKVKDVMLHHDQAPLCYTHDLLENVLPDFSQKRCGCLIVIDENKKLKGILTDGDLRRALQAKGEKVLKEAIGNLMTTKPKAINLDALAWDAMKLMESDQRHPVTVLPVIQNDDECAGLIKMHDIIQAGI